MSWKQHIKYLEIKTAKNIGTMYRTKPILQEESLLALCDCPIHSYLNYANLAWGCTYQTNLRRLGSQQKLAIWIVHNKTKFNILKIFLNQEMY